MGQNTFPSFHDQKPLIQDKLLSPNLTNPVAMPALSVASCIEGEKTRSSRKPRPTNVHVSCINDFSHPNKAFFEFELFEIKYYFYILTLSQEQVEPNMWVKEFELQYYFYNLIFVSGKKWEKKLK